MALRSLLKLVNTTLKSANTLAKTKYKVNALPYKFLIAGAGLAVAVGGSVLKFGGKVVVASVKMAANGVRGVVRYSRGMRQRRGGEGMLGGFFKSIAHGLRGSRGSSRGMSSDGSGYDRKLRRNEFNEEVSPYAAYDFHAPMEKPAKKEEVPKVVDEVSKLAEVDPEKQAVIDELRQAGYIEDTGESILDGMYKGDKRFKSFFQHKKFADGVIRHWEEIGFILKVTFPTEPRVTICAKEDGIFSPEGKHYYVYGGTGTMGDKSVALMKMLNDYPIQHADVLVELLHGYDLVNAAPEKEKVEQENADILDDSLNENR